MPIARLIAEPSVLSASLDAARAAFAAGGIEIFAALPLAHDAGVLELHIADGHGDAARGILDQHFAPSDLLMARQAIAVPRVFVSDMDSTMISAECIDELADYAGLKDHVAEITERAMQGELDFESALRERVALLKGLPVTAIDACLAERIAPMPGARTLVETLKAHGCRTVLVTGGFHHFADPVAAQLGFEHVVANRLAVADGALTGGLIGPITDSSVKKAVLLEEAGRAGDGAVSLATGDGANDIPMLEAATYGLAYFAKPKARAAADGWIDHGDLTSVLRLLGVPRTDWV